MLFWLVKYFPALCFCSFACAGELALHRFERKQLTNVYFSEGANAGDINGDGKVDVVYGPYWFAGPDFTTKHEIYKPVPQDVNRYADNFFSWTYDFNRDGWNDVFVVGFPGTPAYVYENPKADGLNGHWKKHQVIDWVSNESPQFVDLVGDEQPELICTRDGFFGFAMIDSNEAFGPWHFYPVSEQIAASKFGHGLGIGDVNGDGRMDIIQSGGWFEQPPSNATSSRWKLHAVSFSQKYGGAEMYAYDVDGDGDNDIITSHAAHDFGLGWYEQVSGKDGILFKHHFIMGEHPSQNKYGVLFSELHSVNLVDMDGDGLKDIVTGKTYWSHHKQSPMWDAGAVVYWFKLVRGKDGVDWIPYQADGEAGIGRQLTVADVNADGLPDIVVGGMKGTHVLTHKTVEATKEEWQAAQPKIYADEKLPSVGNSTSLRGPKSSIDGATGRVPNAIEGETATVQVSTGQAKPQGMESFAKDKWSGDSQLWWTGARVGDKLTLELPPFSGTVDLEVILTCAKDYGVVQLALDDKPLGEPIDCYNPEVVTTGVLSFPKITVAAGKHSMTAQIVGANPKAVKAYMFAVDCVRVKLADGKFLTSRQSRAAEEESHTPGINPKTLDGRELSLDFESGTLDDWVSTGNAFEGQPIKGDVVSLRRSDMRSGHAGEYWIGGFERVHDAGKGTLTSAPFVVSEPYATFLTNGGESDQTRVELVRKDTGKVFYQVSGTNSEVMRRIVVDLRAHTGKEIMIRLVDSSSGGWGHLNFDHFQLHAARPGNVTPAMVTLSPDSYPHSGLEAKAAAAAMKLPDGFSVTVGAAEPEVKQPIAMAIDDRGRVWIAEAYEYPIRAKGDTGRDRILIFEDTDNNGSLDKRTVFKEGLNLVSGLEVGFGGVWVGAAPYFMFIPDKDGDDVPDADPQILLDGWGLQDTHETLNAFIWGPDGWLYGCHGVFTHSRVGKPGTPDSERIPLNAAVWRYHPTSHEFDVFAHGTSNPWGVDFNDHGQAFITACVIPHLYHVIQGARYVRQGGQHFNPHTYRDIPTIADHLHYLGATPHGGNSKSDSAGGGHAHSGAMIYLGDRWPAQYRNQIFMNNIHGQRLNIDALEPHGSGYVGTHRPDFLLTGDNASQILNLRYGPDGNAWMIDWYDMQACHRHEVERHDRSNGRIYKISYGEDGFSSPKVDLSAATDMQLAELVLHANDWYVRHSRRVLQERASRGQIDPAAINRLRAIATTHGDDTRRLRASWALHVIEALDEVGYSKLLADASPYVRGWAVQMAMESAGNQLSPGRLSQFVAMAKSDSSPVVRLYLASAAQTLPLNDRWALLDALASHSDDATDQNLPLMYWYAAEPLAYVDGTRALTFAMTAGENISLLRELMLRRIGAGGDEAALEVLVQGLGEAHATKVQVAYLSAIREALKGQRTAVAPSSWARVSKQLLASGDNQVRLQAIALGVTFGDLAAIEAMRAQIADKSVGVDDRLVALESLLNANDRELVSTLTLLLSDAVPLREAAIRGLAQYDDPRVATSLLEAYPKLTVAHRRMALGSLCSRPESGVTLLRAIEAKAIPATDLTADLVTQLKFLKDQQIDETLLKVWGSVRQSPADKLALIERYKSLVESTEQPPTDLEFGRTVFASTCMKCHQLYGTGFKVGPDLTGSNRSNLDYLLSNIVDPSSVMANEYRPTVILTDDGRVVSGLVSAETEKSVTLQTSDAQVTVPKAEIEERTLSDKSMMPEDQLKQFSDHQVRSLIAYLRGSEQTPMLATPENTTSFFNGADLSGWSATDGLWSVDQGELVGRTEGLKRNEWIVSDLAVENFHLTVEVKLTGNVGNSGIQFRSKAHDGVVSGYQADVGKGWWGKLYEEHGRALLWDKSGESHVKPDDWNTYDVIAEGHHIRTLINGQPCVDLEDPSGATRGVIAFQLHSGGKTEVRFRNMKLVVK